MTLQGPMMNLRLESTVSEHYTGKLPHHLIMSNLITAVYICRVQINNQAAQAMQANISPLCKVHFPVLLQP